ncbi:VOC family protein [Zavarzinia sp. CC-PAN008]|uniref:VOC family protein n=1 Tax=Zavarzinia sp. CC-PAN008 TaxID=3243332 RepID=UPI003F74A79B
MSVRALGYAGFSVKDVAAWRGFAEGVLGVAVEEAEDGGLRLRVDDRAWRIAVEPTGADDLAYLGFEVEGPAALKELAARLVSAGYTVEADDDLAAKRGVIALSRCIGPAGIPVEFYWGGTQAGERPFVSPQGVRGFVTDGQGFGHVVLATPDIAQARRFFEDLLGFRLSDVIDFAPVPGISLRLVFLHCNPRHHTVALAPMPAPKRLHHFMLQAADFDDVGRAMDRARKAGTPFANGLGKHTNDEMVSFYLVTPSGFEVEFGFGGREIDDATWVPGRHTATSTWGHERLVGAPGAGE